MHPNEQLDNDVDVHTALEQSSLSVSVSVFCKKKQSQKAITVDRTKSLADTL